MGAPGGTNEGLISVAAMVSPAMMEAQYCSLASGTPVPSPVHGLPSGATYTWSSVSSSAATGHRASLAS